MDNWYISTDNGIQMTGILSDIDQQIAALQERKKAIKAISPEIKKILAEYKKASFNKYPYQSGESGDRAYEALEKATRELEEKLESLGFSVCSFADWTCLELH